MMIRSFIPVGQGAFYRETFKRWNGQKDMVLCTVYDCGSTNQVLVEEQIRNEFSEGEVIDAVFISHFDEDHVNGLPFLLHYCNVRFLFFPIITTEDCILMKLKYLSLGYENSFIYRFLENPREAIKLNQNCDTRIIGIIPEQSERSPTNDDQAFPSGRDCSSYIGFDDAHKDGDILWNYIPYNFRQKERIVALRDAIKTVFQGERIPDDNELLSGFAYYKNKIVDAFDMVPGSFNTNSMVLFSGCKNDNIRQYEVNRYDSCECHCYAKYPCRHCRHFSWGNGCLYFGDYDAQGRWKWKSLKSAYREYWNYIGCLQIPHHGSKHNYNTEITTINALNVISVGKDNRFKHPHSQVLRNLLFNHQEIRIVTEDRFSQVDLKCNFPYD